MPLSLKQSGLVLMMILPAATHIRADTLSDLMNTLNDLDGQQSLTAELTTELWQSSGDEPETHGKTTLTLDDGPDGFRIRYSNDLLERMNREQQVSTEDPNADTPVLNTLSHVAPIEMRTHLASADELRRHLEEATLIDEEAVNYDGVPAHRLVFEKGLDTVNDEERQYIKEFEYQMDVWVSEDGIPLKSQTRVRSKGRFMVVIKFEYTEATSAEYAIAGGRLVTLTYERQYETTGFGDGEQVRSRRTLKLL